MGEKIMDGFPSREEALADFFAAWEPARSVEYVALDDAVGRVLACDLASTNTLPVVRASSFDGIAVKSAAFANGMPDTSSWKPGVDYVRADTGDDFPDAFDAVVMIEKAVVREDGSVTFDDDVTVEPGSGVRPAGSTLRAGEPLMSAGSIIRPTDLAALAMGGATMVPVRVKPRVAFIPTGSELVPAGIKPRRGQNVDTNSLMCKHLLIEYGAEPVVFPLVHDDPVELERASRRRSPRRRRGGQRGITRREDFNVKLVERRGQVVHHYIAAVPGRRHAGRSRRQTGRRSARPHHGRLLRLEWCLQAITARILGIPLRRRPSCRRGRMPRRRASPRWRT
ncbi:MAG: molybdopterin molybdenumtransferase MoeA [Eggerthella lenta]